MPTKESLQAKLDGLKIQFTQLQANANAVSGAIQLLEQLLAEEDTPPAPSTTLDQPTV